MYLALFKGGGRKNIFNEGQYSSRGGVQGRDKDTGISSRLIFCQGIDVVDAG